MFERARDSVIKHYQWLVRSDYLLRIVYPDLVTAVFATGRKHFKIGGELDATIPVEFSGTPPALGTAKSAQATSGIGTSTSRQARATRCSQVICSVCSASAERAEASCRLRYFRTPPSHLDVDDARLPSPQATGPAPRAGPTRVWKAVGCREASTCTFLGH